MGGKLSVALNTPLDTQRALSIAYTPGVAQVSRAIAADHTLAARYTWANRMVAVVSDGSAVLGLGDIGPAASLPVMEGKSALFKAFADLDSIPIVLDTKDPDEIVETLVRLRPSFGAVNLEDISAPRCFEIERRVIEALDCPVMHDDQHGTAIVVLAALLGAAEVLDRDITALRVVVSGAGAAGVACAKILLARGIRDITLLDSQGILHKDRGNLNAYKAEIAEQTNPNGLSGGMAEALQGRRRVPRVVRRRRAPRARCDDGARCHRVRAVQPRPGDPSRRREAVCSRGGHRPQRLPEPDQQCARVPGCVPRCARRRGPPHHREDEGGGGRGDLLGGG